MESLPRNVLVYILGFLPAKEYFVDCNLVSKAWYDIVSSWNYTVE